MMLGIGASNLYYPSASRTGTVMATRVGTSVGGWAIGNVACGILAGHPAEVFCERISCTASRRNRRVPHR